MESAERQHKSWTDGDENTSLIISKRQIGKIWTWICSHIGLADASFPQLNTSIRDGNGELSLVSSPGPSQQVSHPLPRRTELGREVPVCGVTRLEKWCFPSLLPALPGNKLDMPDYLLRGAESGEPPLSLGRLPLLGSAGTPAFLPKSFWKPAIPLACCQVASHPDSCAHAGPSYWHVHLITAIRALLCSGAVSYL